MKNEDDLLKQVLADYVESRSDKTALPSDETLIAFAEGKLDPEARASVLEQLSLNGDCTELVLMLMDSDDESLPLEEVDVSAGWEAFKQKAGITDSSETVPKVPFYKILFSKYKTGLAWAFLICFPLWLGFNSFQFFNLNSDDILINVKIVDLYPEHQAERSVEVPSMEGLNEPFIHLILHLEKSVVADSFSVEALDCDQRELWSSRDLKLSEDLNVTLVVPAKQLNTLCHLKLHSHVGSNKVQLATYKVAL